jgi:hypothetical protein
MRCFALGVMLSLVSAYGHAAYVTGTNPNDDANWVPVTIEAPPEFGTIASARIYTIYGDTDSSYADVTIPTAPYQFWLRRGADPHPGHSTWWVDIGLWLNGSPIGGGMNYLLLNRDEATAAALVLRPKPEFYPPLAPPNDRVDWARFWTVDDGTPRDALAITQFRNGIPEPGAATLAIFAAIAVQFRRRG